MSRQAASCLLGVRLGIMRDPHERRAVLAELKREPAAQMDALLGYRFQA